ncbi:MAG: Uma2 family endonuclease [Coleofasciculus sp. B1-GNL1-01]|uniref:Uma2 family endonuclease n=1 Tax=Coleofasciculus sp. B1-GNL1-01 TaxID=3068484 RepID=UPI0033000FD3
MTHTIQGTKKKEYGGLSRNVAFPPRLERPGRKSSCSLRVVKPARESSYEPDVVVLDKVGVANDEPRWDNESIIILGTSIRLVIEVVSTNWSDDYALKLEDYEAMGIPEYWIVDYLGLGGRRYIGNPKQPTFSMYQLVDGVYQVTQFRGNERIVSASFPELNLTANQIFNAGV